MNAADSAGDLPFQGADRSLHLPARARARAARRRFATTTRGRFEGSAAQNLLRQLRTLDVGNSIVLFGSSMLLSVLPFIILFSSLANHRIDTDLSLHIDLNSQGARIISQLFRSLPAHSAAPIVTALILAAAGTMAVAGSLQVIYERVFGQPHRGWRDLPRFVTFAGGSGAGVCRGVTVGAGALVLFGVPDRRIGPAEIAAALGSASLPILGTRGPVDPALMIGLRQLVPPYAGPAEAWLRGQGLMQAGGLGVER